MRVVATLSAAAALAVSVAAAGCGAAPGGGGPPPPATPGGSWQLTSGTGPDGPLPLVEGHPVTLLLEEDDQLGGTAACNAYGGSVRIDGERFDVAELWQTEMACEPEVMAAERAYLDALGAVERIRRSGDELMLSGPSVELRFEPLPPVPTEQLTGTTWELDTLLEGEVASTPAAEATLRLDPDGSIEGETGCRGFSGRYVLGGGEVRITELAADDATCPPGTAAQDRLVLDVVGDAFRAEVEGDRLTLTSSGERGLVYRARG